MRYDQIADTIAAMLAERGPMTTADITAALNRPDLPAVELELILTRNTPARWLKSGTAWLVDNGEAEAVLADQAAAFLQTRRPERAAALYELLTVRRPAHSVYAVQWFTALSLSGSPRAAEASDRFRRVSDIEQYGAGVHDLLAGLSPHPQYADALLLTVSLHRRVPVTVSYRDGSGVKQLVIRPETPLTPDRMAQLGLSEEALAGAVGRARAALALLKAAGGRPLVVWSNEERYGLQELFSLCGARHSALASVETALRLAGVRQLPPPPAAPAAWAEVCGQIHLPLAASVLGGATLSVRFPEVHLAAVLQRTPATAAPAPAAAPPQGLTVDQAFAAEGPIAARSTTYRIRPAQVAMAKAVQETMAGRPDRRPLCCQAPTGVGKSLAYLAAARLGPLAAGERVVISTHTKNLQAQLMEKDIPAMQAALPGGFRSAMLLGCDNYICRRRAERFAREQAGSSDEVRRALAEYLPYWLAVTENGLADDLLGAIGERLEGAGAIIDELRARTGLCAGPDHRDCFWHVAQARAAGADLVVINHALLAARSMRWAGSAHLIADEAHNLEQAVTSAAARLTGSGPLSEVLAQGQDLAAFRRAEEALRSESRRARELAVAVLEAFAPEGEDAPSRLRLTAAMRSEPSISAFFAHAGAMAQRLRQLAAAGPARLGGGNLAGALTDLADVLDEQPGQDPDWVYWVEVDGYNWQYGKAPIHVGGVLKPVLEQFASVTLTSATLAVGGDDEGAWIAGRLGLDRFRWLALASPFRYQEQAVLAIPSDLIRYGDDYRDVPRESEYVVQMAQQIGGRTLVLFTSAERMDQMVRACRERLERLGMELLVQEPNADRTLLARQLAEAPGRLLFALASFWEGVDFPLDQVQCVIIESLPFHVPDDPVHAARAEAVGGVDGGFADYILPAALVRFAQGCGRLIRTEQDTGMVLILDTRLKYKSYRQRFFDAAPPMGEGPLYGNLAVLCARLRSLVGRPAGEPPALPVWQKLALPESTYGEGEYRLIRNRLMDALQNIFGHADFRASGWQEELVRQVLAGHNVIGLVQTGAGKSLCYQLPAVLRKGLTVVVTPVIALMRDQVTTLQALGLGEIVEYYASDRPREELEHVRFLLEQRQLKLLYLSPEQLAHRQMRDRLRSASLVQLVVDEGHCISQWGHTFRPDFLRVGPAAAELGVPVAAFTATAPEAVLGDMLRLLRMPDAAVIRHLTDRTNLHFRVVRFIGESSAVRKLTALVQEVKGIAGQAIVYCATIKNTAAVAEELARRGIRAAAYNADLPAKERTRIQEEFLDGQITVLAATNAFGMGVDHPHIRAVIHYDFPGSLEALYQEAGRAGRDGERAECILFFHPEDRKIQEHFIKQNRITTDDLAKAANLLLDAQRRGRTVLARDLAELFPDGIKDKMLRYWLCDRLQWTEEEYVPTKAELSGGTITRQLQESYPVAVRRFIVKVLGSAGKVDLYQMALETNVTLAQAQELLDHLQSMGRLVFSWRGEDYDTELRLTPKIPKSFAAMTEAFPWDEIAELIRRQTANLEQVIRYATRDNDCRVQQLHAHLGGESVEICGHCDVCISSTSRADHQAAEDHEQALIKRLLLQMIRDVPDARGLGGYIAFLCGLPSKWHRELGTHRYRNWLRDVPYQEVKAIGDQMVSDGLITSNQYRCAHLTESGMHHLRMLGGDLR